jgi:hypothetical protein
MVQRERRPPPSQSPPSARSEAPAHHKAAHKAAGETNKRRTAILEPHIKVCPMRSFALKRWNHLLGRFRSDVVPEVLSTRGLHAFTIAADNAHLLDFVNTYPLKPGSFVECGGHLEADGTVTLCPEPDATRFPPRGISYGDRVDGGLLKLQADHALSETAWDDAVRAWATERASAGCSPDDPWDLGIAHPSRLLQALCGASYSAELGGGISAWRCATCHRGSGFAGLDHRTTFQERNRHKLRQLGLQAGSEESLGGSLEESLEESQKESQEESLEH